jgi:hypothetical protein
MLKPEDIEIQVGRAEGGDFICIIHKPTGIKRGQGPPLPRPGKARREPVAQIEAELVKQGLTQYLLPSKKA